MGSDYSHFKTVYIGSCGEGTTLRFCLGTDGFIYLDNRGKPVRTPLTQSEVSSAKSKEEKEKILIGLIRCRVLPSSFSCYARD